MLRQAQHDKIRTRHYKLGPVTADTGSPLQPTARQCSRQLVNAAKRLVNEADGSSMKPTARQ
jgi:hypothetical protein